MLAAFLLGEIDSPLWSGAIRRHLHERRIPESSIRSPDLTDDTQNAQRAAVLGDYRGWNRNKMLFQHWPAGIQWSFVGITMTDIDNIRYLNHTDWVALSRNTLRVGRAANRVKGGDLQTFRRTFPSNRLKCWPGADP